MKHQTLVTNHGQRFVTAWNTGCTISGNEVRLSLFRVLPSGRIFDHPIYNNMLMESQEHASLWRLIHGFNQVYRGGWCSLCRKQHKWCHSRMSGDCALASHPYEGCAQAQERWDAEDWTRVKVTCGCGHTEYVHKYLVESDSYHTPMECHNCR